MRWSRTSHRLALWSLIQWVATGAVLAGVPAAAEKALAKGKVKEAREAYERGLASTPEAWDIHLALAELDRFVGARVDAFKRVRRVELESDAPRWQARALRLQASLLVDQFLDRARSEILAAVDGSEKTNLTKGAQARETAPRGIGIARGVQLRANAARELELADQALNRATELAGDLDPELYLQHTELLEFRRKWEPARQALESYSRLRPQEAASAPAGRCLDFIETLPADDARRSRPSLDASGEEKTETPRDTWPKKIGGRGPEYTPAARRARLQGQVTIEGFITADGDVTCVALLQGLPLGLGQEAIDVLRSWRFEPATRDGEPIAVSYQITMNFKLGR